MAYAIRDKAFLDQEVGRDVIRRDVSDWYQEAIKYTGWKIAMCLVSLFDEKYRRTKVQKEKLMEFFNPFIINTSCSAQMGRLALARSYVYFYAIDKKWAEKFIMPLFDWTKDITTAIQAWQAYLYYPMSETHLPKHFIDLYSKAFVHLNKLGDLHRRYCYHIAELVFRKIIYDKDYPPESWVWEFITHCEDKDLKSFSEGVLLFLKQNDKREQKNYTKIWEKFLRPYLDQTITGKPQILCKLEFGWMLEWCLYLDEKLPKCVDKIIEADKKCNLLDDECENTKLFHNFKNFNGKYVNDIGKLVEHLLSKKYISYYNWSDLKVIIERLASLKCTPQIMSQIKRLSIGFFPKK